MRKNQISINKNSDQKVFSAEILSIEVAGSTSKASIKVDGGHPSATDPDTPLTGVKFYYHCEPNNTDEGSTAFEVGHKVLVAEVGVDYFIIGFEDLKPRECISPRFFVKIKDGDGFKYYWLILLDDGQYELSVKESVGGSTLEKMLDTPYKNIHTQTKAFMMDGESGPERWVAAPQLLTKNRIQQFLPLNFPAEDDPPEKLPMYPDPSECSGGSPGLNHPCPPNRFYCNVAEKTMTWYTANEWLICGIILKYDDYGNGSAQSFYFTPAAVDDQGFDSYWFYKGAPPNVVSLHPEVPAYMITDIDYLDKGKLRVILPWNWRPVTIEADLSSGALTFNDPDSCKHMFWDGSVSGFKQELLADFSQELDDGSGSYINANIYNDPQDCSGHGSQGGCEDTLEEEDAYSTQSISTDFNNHSNYNMYIFDEEPTSESYSTEIDVYESRWEKICNCQWSPGPEECVGPYCNTYIDQYGNIFIFNLFSYRGIDDNLAQKTVNSINAQWTGPNIAVIYNEINRTYINGYGEQRTNTYFGGDNIADFQNMCNWNDWMPEGCSNYVAAMTVGKCFQGYTMPGDDWAIEGTDTIVDAGTKWIKEATKNELIETPVNKYKIDNVIEIDSNKYDRTYYLDDRSTDESHGIIVAAKDYTPATEDDPEVVHDWEIHWAKSGTSYSDITADVLAALGINKEQLLEIGLI
jgi:hypothetical protein